MRINAIPRLKNDKYKRTGSLMKKILPVVFMLQNFKRFSPNQITEILSFITYPDNQCMLDATDRKELSDYLNHWGYDGGWLDD